jgi:hypothetical protein
MIALALRGRGEDKLKKFMKIQKYKNNGYGI